MVSTLLVVVSCRDFIRGAGPTAAKAGAGAGAAAVVRVPVGCICCAVLMVLHGFLQFAAEKERQLLCPKARATCNVQAELAVCS